MHTEEKHIVNGNRFQVGMMLNKVLKIFQVDMINMFKEL